MRTQSLRAVFALVSLTLAGACDSGPLCSADTTLEDGACVSQRPTVTCGEGSLLDEETMECRAAASCGTGTVWDADSGSCLTAQPCGSGTHVDEASRACVPDATCGAGTVYDPEARLCSSANDCGADTFYDEASGECVPEDRCGAGTLWHPTRHVCVPEVTCGPGLIAHDDVCRSPADIVAADADVVEATPDDNDPAFGGVPETITLEPIGDALVLTGSIARPVDLDADGTLDQDVDHFSFHAPAGVFLRIRVLDDGIGRPGFQLTGPDGYFRQSRMGVVREPSREVVLPVEGDYILQIAPAAFFGDAAPNGSPDHGYVVVIEELAWPAGDDLSVPLLPDAARTVAELFDLTDNFVNIEVEEGVPALFSGTAPDYGTEPVLLVFDGAGIFQQEILFHEDDGTWRALQPVWVAGAGTRVIADWRVSTGFPATVEIAASLLEDADLGAVLPDVEVEAAPVVLPGLYGASLSFDVAPGQIVTAHLPGLTKPHVTLVGPAGVVMSSPVLDRSQLTFVSTQAGRHRLLLVNRNTSDAHVLPAIISTSPRFGGPLTEVSVPVELSGPLLSMGRRVPDRVWALVDLPEGGLLRAEASYLLGMPDFTTYVVSPTGELTQQRRAGEDDRAVRRLAFEEPGRALVLLDPIAIHPHNPRVVDWQVGLEVVPLPVLGAPVPGDDQASAAPLSDPALVVGVIDDEEHHTFSLSPSSQLVAGDLIEVEVENLDGTAATRLTLTDTTGTQIASVRRTTLSAWRLTVADGTPPYLIDVEGDGEAHRYLLSVRRLNETAEVEPNDTPALANLLTAGALPARIEGRTEKDAPDVFSIGAPPLGVNAVLVRVENLQRTGDLDVTVRDAAGDEVMTMDHEDGALLIAADRLPGTVEVVGESTTFTEEYSLSVHAFEVGESEPNDTPATANPVALGADPVVLWAQQSRGLADVFRIDLDTPLGDDESISVRWFNSLERGDLLVRVLDESGNDIVTHEDYSDESVVTVAGQTLFVSVEPLSSSTATRPELYRLDLERIARRAEREPNDASATAQALPAAFALTGHSRVDDPDVYALDVATLTPGLMLSATSQHELFEITIVVRDSQGVVLHSATAPSLTISLDEVELPSAGVALLEVTAQITGAGELGVYRLSLQPG